MSKTDRTARLLKVAHLLYQHPHGLKMKDIGEACGVDVRTAYRDVHALEMELNYPIFNGKHKWGIMEGFMLPPISFNLPEAMTVFLAARLMLRYANEYDPNIASTFIKLNSIVPSPLKEQIEKTLDWMRGLNMDEHYLMTIASLAEAWRDRTTISMIYHTLGDKKPSPREVDPYFIEPAAAGHASYLIGYCHRTDSIRVFNIDRIKNIECTSKSYNIPPDFDANEYLASAWGIVAGKEAITIKLKFTDPGIARIQEEVIWHPSQVTERQSDGSLLMTLKVSVSDDLVGWILSWGENVEVLEPDELRSEVTETARAMLDIYE